MKILSKGTYYGKKKLEFATNGLVLSEYDYRIPQTDWHYHENPYFMYVIEGNLFDVNRNGKTTCPPGSLLLHNWDETHYNAKASRYARGFHVEFERSWYEQKKLDVGLWEGSHRIENPAMHHLLGKIYYEFKCQDQYAALSIDLLLLQLCESSQLKQQKDLLNTPAWVTRLREILHDDTFENLNLQHLSDELGVHPVHISRAIPKYFSTTLGNYMRQQKIKIALSLLFDPRHSLSQIAYLCGFSDQSHFTRTFKSYFGITPKDFRVRL